ncbi:MAG: hypothetical protein ABIO29_05510 [Sphingomicrobium sp.]
MSGQWMRRVEAVAEARRRAVVKRLAIRLSQTLRGASVAVEEARVVVTGKGLVKRWLIDPELRFLSGDLQ